MQMKPGGVVRDLCRDSPGCGHQEDLSAPCSFADEGDCLPIRRKSRLEIVGRIGGQALGCSAGSGGDPEIPAVRKDNRMAIRRESRSDRKLNPFFSLTPACREEGDEADQQA